MAASPFVSNGSLSRHYTHAVTHFNLSGSVEKTRQENPCQSNITFLYNEWLFWPIVYELPLGSLEARFLIQMLVQVEERKTLYKP